MSEAPARPSGDMSRRQENHPRVDGGGVSEARREGRTPALAVAAPAGDAHEDLTPRERLEILCDPGSLHVIRSVVRSNALGEKAKEGDGVIGASGTIAGRPIFCYAQDGRFAGGSLGNAHAETIV